MKQSKALSMVALLSAGLLLAGCSFIQGDKKESSTPKSEVKKEPKEKKKTEEDLVREDVETLLSAMLTEDDQGFSRLYGDDYDSWTEAEVFPGQARDRIEENDYSPEEDFTFRYVEGGDSMTPTEVLTKFLISRRDNLKDITDFEVTDITVDGDDATVTVESRHINNTAAANAITNLYIILFGGNIDALAGMNQANSASADFKKVQTLLSFFLYQQNFDNLLVSYSDVPLRLNETPLTEGIYEVTFDLEKNSEDHWVISVDNYEDLVADLLNDKETADQIVYPDGTTPDGDDSSSSTTTTEDDDNEDDNNDDNDDDSSSNSNSAA